MSSRKLQIGSAVYGIVGLIIYFAIRFSCGMPGATEVCDERAQSQSTWFALITIGVYLVLAWIAPREPRGK